MAIEWLSFPKGMGEERECCVEPGALPATTQRSACKVYSAGSYRSLRREATCWRELSFSFLRILVMWWCTVCSEMKRSLAIWALLSPCATRVATSLSRRVRAGGSSSNSLLDAGDIGDVGSSSERAYSTPFSSVMPCPSVHAASHETSFSEERAASRYGSSHASTSGECWYATAPIVSRSASATPNSVAARSAPPSAPDIHASPSRLSEAIILSPSSLHTTRLSPYYRLSRSWFPCNSAAHP